MKYEKTKYKQQYENEAYKFLAPIPALLHRCKREKMYFAAKRQLTKVVSSDYGWLERSLISFWKSRDICSLNSKFGANF